MIIDLHCHEKSFSSCSTMSLDDIIDASIYYGLDGICITDHDSMKLQENCKEILLRKPFPVFFGAEVSTSHGHIIAFGIEMPKNAHSMQTQDFVTYAKDSGGFSFVAHPFRGSGCGYFTETLVGLDGIEVYNGRCSEEMNKKAVELCDKLKLQRVAGSDAHEVDNIGVFAVKFDKKISNCKQLVDELKLGNIKTVKRIAKCLYEEI